MSTRRSYSYGAAVLVAALASGCTNGASTASGFNPAAAPHVVTKPNSQALLYVSEPARNSVLIYTFPGLRPRGSLTGLYHAEGLCVDSSTGNVWVVEGAFANKLVEFAHGSTIRMRSIALPGAYYPQGCAVDPATGDLAVTTYIIEDDPGAVAVYRHARGSGTQYQNRQLFFYSFAAYDGSGNLFVDATGGHYNLAELREGGKKLEVVPVSGLKIEKPGGIQYDGANIAIGAEEHGVIYQISKGTIVGTTTLKDACFVQQFFIYDGRVIAPNRCGKKGNVLVYDYPAGGAPIEKISNVAYPFAAVVSP